MHPSADRAYAAVFTLDKTIAEVERLQALNLMNLRYRSWRSNELIREAYTVRFRAWYDHGTATINPNRVARH